MSVNVQIPASFNTGGTVSAPLLAPNGTAAAPAYGFSAAPGYGMYYDSTNTSLAATAGGVETVQISNPGGTVPTLQIGPIATGVRIRGLVGGSGQINLDSNNGAGNAAIQAYAYYGNQLVLFSGGGGLGGSTGLYVNGGQCVLSMNNLPAQTWNSTTGASTFVSTINYKAATASKTAAYPVVAADSATVFDNTGAAAGVTFTLPAAAVGLTYTFGTHAAQIITVAPQATDAIGAKAVNTAYASTAAAGLYFTVTCTAANYWLITSNNGFA